jgi:hypothetical protein
VTNQDWAMPNRRTKRSIAAALSPVVSAIAPSFSA